MDAFLIQILNVNELMPFKIKLGPPMLYISIQAKLGKLDNPGPSLYRWVDFAPDLERIWNFLGYEA